MLEPQEGDAEQWIIVGRLFSAAALPPTSPFTGAPVQSGELAIFGQAGACLHLMANGTWFLQGNLTVNGSVSATGNVVAGLGGPDQAGLQTHNHGGVTAGVSHTTAPTAGS